MQRTITYILTRDKAKRDFVLLKDLCHKSKNLYNYVNYIIRQAFTGNAQNIPEFRDLIYNGKRISEYALSKRLGQLNQVDFRGLKTQVSQQIIKQVFKNYKSFFKAVKVYKKNDLKFNGRPKLPKYKDKAAGMNVVCFTNQSISFDKANRCLKISKDIVVKSVRYPFDNSQLDFQQVRIVPRNGYFQIEIVIDIKEGEYTKKAKQHNKKTTSVGIDIGVGNLATVTSDDPALQPLIVNGKSLKSVNHLYNKRLAILNAVYSKNGIHTGRKLRQLNMKRQLIMNDYMHKSSRRVVDYCILNNVKSVYIGHNDGWKQKCRVGNKPGDMAKHEHTKQNNQNFVQISFNSFISKLKYKLEAVGIECVLLNEAYTSKCSTLDCEAIGFHGAYAGKRVKRGLFKSKAGKLMNADVNGSLNILRLGLKKDFEAGNKFNPIAIKRINELSDAVYFNWRPADIGCVSQPNGIDNTIEDF